MPPTPGRWKRIGESGNSERKTMLLVLKKWITHLDLGINLSYARGIGVGLIAGVISGAAGQGIGTIALVMGLSLMFIGAWIHADRQMKDADRQMKERLKKLDAEAVKPS
jgi:hypothetical protein